METKSIELSTNITSNFYDSPYLPIVAKECEANHFFQNLTHNFVGRVKRKICELIFNPNKNPSNFHSLVGRNIDLLPTIIKEGNPIYIGNINVLDLITSMKLKSTGNTALHASVYQYDCNNTQYLLQAKANPNEQNNNGETPLVVAIKRFYSDCTKVLVPVSDIDQTDSGGNTPLMIAADLNNLDAINQLLQANPTVDKKNKAGKTALILATALYPLQPPINQLMCVQALLDQGKADPNVADDDDKTPLMHVASAIMYNRNEYLQIAKELLKAGANIHLRDKKKGYTAFEWAVENQHTNIITLLSDAELEQQRARLKLIEEAKKLTKSKQEL